MKKKELKEPKIQKITNLGFDSFRPDGITYVPQGHSEFCKKMSATVNEEQAEIEARRKDTESRFSGRSGRWEIP